MQRTKFLILLSALLLCSIFSSCGVCTKAQDAAGGDWRTSGVVIDSGTLHRSGEEIRILVCADAHSAALYYDTADHVLYDTLSFPETIDDAHEAFGSITFSDPDGCGTDDITITLYHADMSVSTLVWRYDAERGYVYQPDESALYVNSVQTEP